MLHVSFGLDAEDVAHRAGIEAGKGPVVVAGIVAKALVGEGDILVAKVEAFGEGCADASAGCSLGVAWGRWSLL